MNLKKFFFILSIVISVGALGKVPKEVKVPKAKKQLASQRTDLPLFMRREEWNEIQQLTLLRNQQNAAVQTEISNLLAPRHK